MLCQPDLISSSYFHFLFSPFSHLLSTALLVPSLCLLLPTSVKPLRHEGEEVIGRKLLFMSDFLHRIKARLETGQHYTSNSSEEAAGWVRAALANLDDQERADTEEVRGGGESSRLHSEWQTELVKKMEGVGLGSVDVSPSLNKSWSSLARGGPSSRDASQTLWESKSVDCGLPNGFYSVIPSLSLTTRFPTIPTLKDLQLLGPESEGLDVLLVDTNRDKTLVNLQELVRSLVEGIGNNVPAMIKKIAELVADFYGGPVSEAGCTKSSRDDYISPEDSCTIQLLGEVKTGLCRPRAILFKLLGDTVGLQSCLLMGLQLEAVPSSSLICANPNKHLSNIVAVNGIELLVDLMRHPGYLRPFSRKALVMNHIAGAGDSDSAEYDSCDSPLEPNSPLYGVSEKTEHETLEQDIEIIRPPHPRRGLTAAVLSGLMPLNLVPRHPVGIEGKLSPSRSEPDLANHCRLNRQRAAVEQIGTSLECDAEAQRDQRRSWIESFQSFPSSSPEHPMFRVRAPSMLSGSRLHSGEDINTSSPDASPQHPSAAEKLSPVFRRRSASSFSIRPGEDGRRERALSVDLRHEGRGVDFLHYVEDSALRRAYQSPHTEFRRARKRSVAPEISDEVVRAVRAMNEAFKQEHVQNTQRNSCASDGCMLNSRGGSAEDSGRLVGSKITTLEGKEKDVLCFNNLEFNAGSSSGSAAHASRLVVQSNQKLVPDEFSAVNGNSDTNAWPLPMHSPCLPSQPLMPFSEWNIEFSELRIGVRVGIGSFGEVFRGIWRGTEVAIKVMLEQDLTVVNTQDFCNEISLLSRLRHPNVILFLGACIKPPHLSMVTEYMHVGSLYRLIHSSGQGRKLSWRRRLKMLRDICRGMMSVQRMKIVHRDLKSANCLVDKHWSVKICDFGLSRIVTSSTVCDQSAVGTPEWTAPELLRNEPVTDKCDVFSLGVIMWELSTLKRPWEGIKPMQIVYAVAHNRARLEKPEGHIGKLIADCWEEVPAARPSYEEILTRLHECEFLQS